MLKVRGDSMIEAGILDGDYVVVRRQPEAESGDIVVAAVGNDEATVKTLRKRRAKVVLVPANPAYSEIELAAGEVVIYGKVVTVLRRLEAGGRVDDNSDTLPSAYGYVNSDWIPYDNDMNDMTWSGNPLTDGQHQYNWDVDLGRKAKPVIGLIAATAPRSGGARLQSATSCIVPAGPYRGQAFPRHGSYSTPRWSPDSTAVISSRVAMDTPSTKS